MKNILIWVYILSTFATPSAQTELDFTGKTFQQVEKIPNSTTELHFTSKNQVTYIITNIINGKTYIDKCNGKATLSGNKISVKCICDDKELYPDPISDSFVYNATSKTLTSTSYRSTDGVYLIWKLK
jgi:hypothetical protein